MFKYKAEACHMLQFRYSIFLFKWSLVGSILTYFLIGVCMSKSLDNRLDALANGKAGKHVPAPQKSLPDLPPPRTVSNVQSFWNYDTFTVPTVAKSILCIDVICLPKNHMIGLQLQTLRSLKQPMCDQTRLSHVEDMLGSPLNLNLGLSSGS